MHSNFQGMLQKAMAIFSFILSSYLTLQSTALMPTSLQLKVLYVTEIFTL